MNRGIIIGIIAIIIGVSALVFSQSSTENNVESVDEIPIIENTENKPKQFTVGLTEKVGIQETP